MTTATAERFEAKLNALHNDAVACARYSFTQLAIDSSTEPELREFLNHHALFWNTVRSGLQASAIVAMGRIYDSRRDTNAADRTLLFAETQPGIFNKEFLKARRMRSGLSEQVAADYVTDAFEPGQTGFSDLRKMFDEMRSIYESSAKDIRHNVFAHAGQLTADLLDELFSGFKTRDFERLVVFPLQLWDALFNLYWNGREPVVRDAPTLITEIIATGVPDNVSTWEHLHAAASAKAFLEFLRPLYPKLYDPKKGSEE